MFTRTDSRAHRAHFATHGYTVCRQFFSAAEIEHLLAQIRRTPLPGLDRLSKPHMTFYSNLFRHNQAIQTFIAQPRIVEFLAPIIGPDFWVRWDQAVEKRSGGEEFPWHQDSVYSKLYSTTYYQLWIAITDMRPDNGGLWLQPGSHRQGALPHRRLDNHLSFEQQLSEPVFIEATAGDVVLFSSLLLHRTTPNYTQDSRWAYVVEYMDLQDFDPNVDAPYFIVAQNGQPAAHFAQDTALWSTPSYRWRYFLPQLKTRTRQVLERLNLYSRYRRSIPRP